jgi:hypothetical protein
MYGLTNASELSQKPVSAGKHEDVSIIEITKEDVGEQKIPTITFKFGFPDGSTFVHREFPVNRENIVKNISKFPGKKVEEVMAQELKRTSQSILHIFTSFIPVDKLIFVADSWEDYITKLIDLAGTAYESQRFRCKIVYTKKGYLSFPKSTVSPWFQNMEEADKITINTKWDILTPPAPTKEADLEPSFDTTQSLEIEDVKEMF